MCVTTRPGQVNLLGNQQSASLCLNCWIMLQLFYESLVCSSLVYSYIHWTLDYVMETKISSISPLKVDENTFIYDRDGTRFAEPAPELLEALA